MSVTAPTVYLARKCQPSLWMASEKFDLIFFHLSGIACLFLIVPYLIMGDKVIFPIYNFYLIFFGIPHNYLTWATLLPASARKTFNMEPIGIAAIICVVIAMLIPLTKGSGLNDWILSLIAYLSLWHAYRQHHGICKVYDAIQAKRTNDFTIFQDRKYMNLFFGLVLNGVMVWVFTYPNIQYFLSADEKYNLIYPVVPMHIFYLYCAVTCIIGVVAIKKCIWNRFWAGKFIPWPQLSLMMIATLTYVVPYCFISLSAMPIAVAIGTIYHNVQYFGFVWLFEKYRSRELLANDVTLQFPQRLVHQKSWMPYFSMAFLYSIIMLMIYSVTPECIGMTLIYFLATAHYVIDGYLWKKGHNSLLNPVIHRIALEG